MEEVEIQGAGKKRMRRVQERNMISVIVPVYNVKPYLEEAVDSVINQSFRDLEIILVDDGSTDGSGEICDRYREKDSRIKVIHQENKGLSAARNAGLDICMGERIAFLDSDDAFCRDALLKLSRAMDESGADIVECNFAEYYGDKKMDERKIGRKRKCICPKKDRTGVYGKKEALRMQVRGEIAPVAWDKLYRKEIWREQRFREGQNFEDTDIILLLLSQVERVYAIDDKLVMHRKRKSSITATYTLKNLQDLDLSISQFMEYMAKLTPRFFDEETYSFQMNRNLNNYLSKYYYYSKYGNTDKQECLKYIRKIIEDIVQKNDVKKYDLSTRIVYSLYASGPKFVYMILVGFYFFVKNPMKRICLK